MSVTSLSVDLGVSRRTIFRDLSVLRQSGVPIGVDPTDWQLTLDPSQRFLTRLLSDDEIRTIVLAARTSCLLASPNIRQSLQGAISKLLGTIRSQQRRHIHRLLRHCVVGPNYKGGDWSAEVLEVVTDGIGRQHILRLRYLDGRSGNVLETKFHPYALSFQPSEISVSGWSARHHAMRTIDLTAIREAELLGETFTIPRGYYGRKLTKMSLVDNEPQPRGNAATDRAKVNHRRMAGPHKPAAMSKRLARER